MAPCVPVSSSSSFNHFKAEEARAQLDIALDWGRYAELYEYDADHDELRQDDSINAT